MHVDIQTTNVKPIRQTVSSRTPLGADKPASRYQEATMELQPESELSLPAAVGARARPVRQGPHRDRDGGLVRVQGPAPVLLRRLHDRPRQAAGSGERKTSSSTKGLAARRSPTPPRAHRSSCRWCRSATTSGPPT